MQGVRGILAARRPGGLIVVFPGWRAARASNERAAGFCLGAGHPIGVLARHLSKQRHGLECALLCVWWWVGSP